MNLKQTLRLNEIFGPTIQGEGTDVGKPCYFIRTQGCPVQCPGCDTAFTWDGSERGQDHSLEKLVEELITDMHLNPGCGVVVSGGEPLIHFRNKAWTNALQQIRHAAQWLSLETSGFFQSKEITYEERSTLARHLMSFDTVHCSPKITPCLRGPKWTDEDMDVNLDWIRESFYDKRHTDPRMRGLLAFKYVVRDEEDLKAVLAHVEKHKLKFWRHPIYLMPYGVTEEEVAEGCRRLVPWCAANGFLLSPRLHSLLWGKRRGV